MAGKILRSIIAVCGILAALVWSALFLASPRVSLELLVAFAPIVVPIWLITMLTRSGTRTRRGPTDTTGQNSFPSQTRAAVLARDGGICTVCADGSASGIAARRPARVGEADPLSRFVSLCADCAAVTPLVPAARRGH